MGVHSFFILQLLGLGLLSMQMNNESDQEHNWIKSNPAEKGIKKLI